jgi:hypothetical protein
MRASATGRKRQMQMRREDLGSRSILHSISDFCTVCEAVGGGFLGIFIDFWGGCGCIEGAEMPQLQCNAFFVAPFMVKSTI